MDSEQSEMPGSTSEEREIVLAKFESLPEENNVSEMTVDGQHLEEHVLGYLEVQPSQLQAVQEGGTIYFQSDGLELDEHLILAQGEEGGEIIVVVRSSDEDGGGLTGEVNEATLRSLKLGDFSGLTQHLSNDKNDETTTYVTYQTADGELIGHIQEQNRDGIISHIHDATGSLGIGEENSENQTVTYTLTGDQANLINTLVNNQAKRELEEQQQQQQQQLTGDGIENAELVDAAEEHVVNQEESDINTESVTEVYRERDTNQNYEIDVNPQTEMIEEPMEIEANDNVAPEESVLLETENVAVESSLLDSATEENAIDKEGASNNPSETVTEPIEESVDGTIVMSVALQDAGSIEHDEVSNKDSEFIEQGADNKTAEEICDISQSNNAVVDIPPEEASSTEPVQQDDSIKNADSQIYTASLQETISGIEAFLKHSADEELKNKVLMPMEEKLEEEANKYSTEDCQDNLPVKSDEGTEEMAHVPHVEDQQVSQETSGENEAPEVFIVEEEVSQEPLVGEEISNVPLTEEDITQIQMVDEDITAVSTTLADPKNDCLQEEIIGEQIDNSQVINHENKNGLDSSVPSTVTSDEPLIDVQSSPQIIDNTFEDDIIILTPPVAAASERKGCLTPKIQKAFQKLLSTEKKLIDPEKRIAMASSIQKEVVISPVIAPIVRKESSNVQVSLTAMKSKMSNKLQYDSDVVHIASIQKDTTRTQTVNKSPKVQGKSKSNQDDEMSQVGEELRVKIPTKQYSRTYLKSRKPLNPEAGTSEVTAAPFVVKEGFRSETKFREERKNTGPLIIRVEAKEEKKTKKPVEKGYTVITQKSEEKKLKTVNEKDSSIAVEKDSEIFGEKYSKFPEDSIDTREKDLILSEEIDSKDDEEKDILTVEETGSLPVEEMDSSPVEERDALAVEEMDSSTVQEVDLLVDEKEELKFEEDVSDKKDTDYEESILDNESKEEVKIVEEKLYFVLDEVEKDFEETDEVLDTVDPDEIQDDVLRKSEDFSVTTGIGKLSSIEDELAEINRGAERMETTSLDDNEDSQMNIVKQIAEEIQNIIKEDLTSSQSQDDTKPESTKKKRVATKRKLFSEETLSKKRRVRDSKRISLGKKSTKRPQSQDELFDELIRSTNKPGDKTQKRKMDKNDKPGSQKRRRSVPTHLIRNDSSDDEEVVLSNLRRYPDKPLHTEVKKKRGRKKLIKSSDKSSDEDSIFLSSFSITHKGSFSEPKKVRGRPKGSFRKSQPIENDKPNVSSSTSANPKPLNAVTSEPKKRGRRPKLIDKCMSEPTNKKGSGFRACKNGNGVVTPLSSKDFKVYIRPQSATPERNVQSYTCKECHLKTYRIDNLIRHSKKCIEDMFPYQSVGEKTPTRFNLDIIRTPKGTPESRLLARTPGSSKKNTPQKKAKKSEKDAGCLKDESSQSIDSKANDQDFSEPSDCDSDESDLPPAFDIEMKNLYGFSEDDVVWAEWRGQHWPALVKKMYPKKKKVSIVFIDTPMPKNSFKLNILKITNFDNAAKNKLFLGEGCNLENNDNLIKAVQKSEDYLRKRCLGLKISATQFFNNPEDVRLYITELEEEANEQEKDELIIVDPHPDLNQIITPPIEVEDHKDESEKSDSKIEINQTEEEIKLRKEIRKNEEEKLVKLITEGHVADHLLGVYKGTINSNRHKLFNSSVASERNQLKHATYFGTINDEPLQTQVVQYCLDLFKQNIIPDESFHSVGYAFEVWAPEAVVKAISVDKQTTIDEAEEIFAREDLEESDAERIQQSFCLNLLAGGSDEEDRIDRDETSSDNINIKNNDEQSSQNELAR